MQVLKSLKKIMTLPILLSLNLACNFVTSIGNSENPSDCYQVTFLDSTENSDGTSIWAYSVEELACAQDLSNWMLEIPECAFVMDASPSPWEIVHPDPNYYFNGIKWQTGAGFQSERFIIELAGELTTGMVKFGVKGPDVAIGLVEGPVCEQTTVTPTLEQTATATTTIDETPTATVAVPTIQPPASTGTILITDNDQILTFTCNGNAVEVRGNANTITLLGSCGSITVKGNANVIYWQSGSPVITDTGNENIISQR